jgi:hypothetical protein
MASPNANVYRLIDDYGVGAGPPGGAAGSTSGQPVCADFVALTLANACQVAHIISSALQRPVRVVPLAGAPPYTLITGVGCALALTQVPSGITF